MSILNENSIRTLTSVYTTGFLFLGKWAVKFPHSYMLGVVNLEILSTMNVKQYFLSRVGEDTLKM